MNQLYNAPLAIRHLSHASKSVALDLPSWMAWLKNEEVAGDEKGRKIKISERHPSRLVKFENRRVDREQASRLEYLLRKCQGLLQLMPAKPSKEERLEVARKFEQATEGLPKLDGQDGDEAFLANARAGIFYLARSLALEAKPKDLTTQLESINWLLTELLGTRSLAGFDQDDLTHLAASFINLFSDVRERRAARKFILDFINVVRGAGEFVFEKGCSLAPLDKKSPELKVRTSDQPRRILTPGQVEGLLELARDEEELLAFQFIIGCQYYCGMREGEVLALLGFNYQPGPLDRLQLTYSKTKNGLRPVPISRLLPPGLREPIMTHISQRALEKPYQPLLENGPSHMLRFENILGKKYQVGSHALRHAFATITTLRLELAYNLINDEPIIPGLERLRRILEEHHGQLFSRSKILDLADCLLGPAWRRNLPMVIPVVSKLMGHGHPGVTQEVYIHSTDFLATFSRPQVDLSLSAHQVEQFLGLDHRTLKKWMNNTEKESENYGARTVAALAAAKYLPSKVVKLLDLDVLPGKAY